MGISADLFVSQPVPEYFKCPICLEVLQDPVLACSEEHLNCRKCLQSIKDSGKTSCATCRRPFPLEVRPAKLVSRSIEALEVRCRYHKKGCKWKGPVGNRVIHLPQCSYKPRLCKHSQLGCVSSGTSAEQTQHLATVCPFEQIRCPRCRITIRRERSQLHEFSCTAWSCTVTAGCPTRSTKTDMVAHEKFCKAQSSKLKEETDARKSAEKANSELKKENSKLKAAIRTENALKKATAPATSVEQAPPPAGPSADNLKSVPLSLSKPKRNVRPSLVLREAQDAAELEKDRKAAAKGKRARSASVTASGSDDGEKEAKVAKKVA